jgi:hypothetical protein
MDRTREDLLWSRLCKEAIGYFVGTGITSKATCRGCSKTFPQNEPRVMTNVLLGGLYPSKITVSFCFSQKCIKDGIKRYSPKVITVKLTYLINSPDQDASTSFWRESLDGRQVQR